MEMSIPVLVGILPTCPQDKHLKGLARLLISMVSHIPMAWLLMMCKGRPNYEVDVSPWIFD